MSTDTAVIDNIWKTCSENNDKKPWLVISVIGDSSTLVPTTWEKSLFQESLISTAKGAKECWILYNGGEGTLCECIRKAVTYYRITTLKEGRKGTGRIKHMDIWKHPNRANIKLIGICPSKQPGSQTIPPHATKKNHFEIPAEEYDDVHASLLKMISQEMVEVLQLQKKMSIRIPVVALLAEGNVKTIRHVDKILQKGIPVILVKGSGKAADIILEYLTHGRMVIKSKAPLLFGTYTQEKDFIKVKELMKSIKRKRHLISVFDVTGSVDNSLSDLATEAILKAWSTNEDLLSKELLQEDTNDVNQFKQSVRQNIKFDVFLVPPNIEQFARMKEDSREDLFEHRNRIPNLNEKNPTNADSFNTPRPVTTRAAKDMFSKSTSILATKWLNPYAFPLYYFIAYQYIQIKFRDHAEKYTQNFRNLLLITIEADKLEYVNVIMKEHNIELDHSCFSRLYKVVKCEICEEVACQHLYSVLKTDQQCTNLFEDNNCSETARQICRNFLHYSKANDSSEKNKSVLQDLLIWSLFAHRPRLATLFWNACDNQLVVSLLAAGLLRRMAFIAKDVADQSVYQDLLAHSKSFEKRSLEIQTNLYKDYPNDAMEIVTTEFNVWDVKISPLQCAYENDFYDFVAHPCSQRCLTKIWYNKLGTTCTSAIKTALKLGHHYEANPFCKLVRAPFTKLVVNYAIFLLGLVLYSAFLLTNVRTVDKIGWFEIFVYVWIVTDMIENYVVFLPQREKQHRFKDKWYRFLRYIQNFWNILDTLSYITTIVAFILRLNAVTLKWAMRIYSLSLILMFMRFLQFILIYKKVGVYVILIKEMMKDLARFVIILILFMMAVGVVYHANMFRNHTDMWPSGGIEHWRIWTIIGLPYLQIYGEIFLDTVKGTDECTPCNTNSTDSVSSEENDWILLVVLAVYMLISNLLLVNLVIALFSARFEKVRANSEKIWRYTRYSYIQEYRVRLPAIINIPLRIVSIGLFVVRKCKKSKVVIKITPRRRKEEDDILLAEDESVIRIEHIKTLQSMYAARCT